MTQAEATAGLVEGARRRLPGLDGLRGLAALVVVIHHSLLVHPALADAYAGSGANPDVWEWWLTRTPLHLLWDGPAAVSVFFVLSGFVLVLPFLRSPQPRWRVYYPARMVRLYLPVWGAAVFTIALILIIHRQTRPEWSWWINAHGHEIELWAIVKDLTLIGGVGGLNSPLWSLQWEVIFSLLLPAYLWVALRLRRYWVALVLLLPLAAALGGKLGSSSLSFLPVFGIGVVMAANRDALDEVSSRLPGWAWSVVVVASLALMNAGWYPFRVPLSGTLTVAGAALMVFVFYGWTRAIQLGSASMTRWLGQRSFSLYLIHEPVVVTVAMAMNTTDPLLELAVAIPSSLLAAAVFYRWIEEPSHRASKAAGRWASSKLARVS